MAATTGTRLWTRDLALTLLGTVTFFGSLFYLLSVLPDYVDSVGGAKWQVGLIVGGISVVPLVLRPFVGRWSDAGRRKLLMRIGLVTLSASFVLMVFSEDVWSLFALRLVQGIGMTMFPTSAASLVAEVSPLPRRGEGLSFFGMAGGLAQIATPALGVVIVELWGFDAVFLLAAATAAATLLIVQPIREPAVHVSAGDAGAGAGRLVPRAALFPTLVLLTVGFSFTAAATFLPLLGDERDLGNVGLFFLVAGATNIVTRPIAGRVADRVGRSAAIVPGLVASAGSMWLLAVAFAPPTMWAAGLLLGVGVGAAHTGLFALTVDRVTASERGRATAVFQLAWDISASVGGIVLGLVASGLDVAAVYWITGAVVVVGLGVLLAGPRRRPATVPAQP